MQHETVNTGYVFLVIWWKDLETTKSGFDNVLQESHNPYNTFIELRALKPHIELTLVNWAFVSKENYLKLKKNTHERKHLSNGTANGGSLQSSGN